MFTKTLFGKTKDTLALLGRSHLLDKAYLGGGSACALHLGHRNKSILKVNIADLRDIVAMKIDAIAARGRKRDFIDLYFICKEKIPLERALFFYNRKYGKLSSNIVHIHKSLVYFMDAETEEMPRMLKEINWEDVKDYFETEVKKLI